MQKNEEELFIKLSKKKLNLYDTLKLYKLLLKIPENNINLVKLFLDNYYNINSLPDEFYKMFLYCIHSNKYNELFKILYNKNIYELISYLKSENEKIINIEYLINPSDYFTIPHKQIKFIVEHLKKIDLKNDELELKKLIKNRKEWLIRKNNLNTEQEFINIAIKMYLSVGLDNAIDILCAKYGEIDYEIIYYLFNNLNVKNNSIRNNEIFNKFLFNNKKDSNNNMRLIIEGYLLDLFINFDYFYNNINYFVEQLGTKLNHSKLNTLIKEKYLPQKLENVKLNEIILQDMISSYNQKLEDMASVKEIIDKNMNAYLKLKNKTKSSIIKVDIPKIEDFTFELLPLDDVKNLVMGYRAGNCFRINGDAFMLFNNFLTNPHMRLLSISTDEHKDFGMVLLMRNGNVLIAQGIELSKRINNQISSEKLYNATKKAIKFIMDKMNNEDDEIVASIIGLTNSYTEDFNHNILPFLIDPLIDNNHQYYNGICNYQGLLDLKCGKSLNDIKLFIPNNFYFDKSKIYKRNEFTSPNNCEYREIEKILISLRYEKFKKNGIEDSINYYNNLVEKHEVYTICTLNWFIRVFQDGYIDTYINSNNPSIIEEYNIEMQKVKNRFSSQKLTKK